MIIKTHYVPRMFRIYIFNCKPQNNFFFQVFCDTLFSLDIFTTHLTMQCYKCHFHLDNHIDQVDSVTFVETISRRNSTSENNSKKKPNYSKTWRRKKLKFRLANISNMLLDKKSPVNGEAVSRGGKQIDR